MYAFVCPPWETVNQHHDGVCCYYILRVLHLGYPVAMPAAAFYQDMLKRPYLFVRACLLRGARDVRRPFFEGMVTRRGLDTGA